MFPWIQRVTVEDVIQQIASEIEKALGEKLVSLIVFGQHAQPNDVAENNRQPANFLIVANELDIETLATLADVFEANAHKALIAPMILSLEELHGSLDVFPITFLDMQRSHRVLAGKDILEELDIGREHLRLRCEQELKNLLFRMQSAYLLQSRSPKRLGVTLQRSYQSFLKTLRATLSLVDEQTDADTDALFKHAREVLGIETQTLQRVDELSGVLSNQFGADGVASVFGEFMLVVQQAANAIDELPDEVTVLCEVDDE